MDVIRSVCGISTTELSDDELSALMSIGVIAFNQECNIEVGGGNNEYELLTPSDDDDTETVFFTKHFPIADMDGDASVSASADVLVYDDDKQGTPSALTVSAIDAKAGKITLSAAASGDVYAKYHWCPYAADSNEVKMAFTWYISMMVWDRLIATAETVSQGGISVTRRNYFRDRWLTARNHILGSVMLQTSESKDQILTGEDEFEDPEGEES